MHQIYLKFHLINTSRTSIITTILYICDAKNVNENIDQSNYIFFYFVHPICPIIRKGYHPSKPKPQKHKTQLFIRRHFVYFARTQNNDTVIITFGAQWMSCKMGWVLICSSLLIHSFNGHIVRFGEQHTTYNMLWLYYAYTYSTDPSSQRDPTAHNPCSSCTIRSLHRRLLLLFGFPLDGLIFK